MFFEADEVFGKDSACDGAILPRRRRRPERCAMNLPSIKTVRLSISALMALHVAGDGASGDDRARVSADARASAEGIVKAVGVRAGLCVHLGADDGELTAALGEALGRGEGAYIVRGLASDAPSLFGSCPGRESLDHYTGRFRQL